MNKSDKNKKILFNKNNILIEEYYNEKNEISYVNKIKDCRETKYLDPYYFYNSIYRSKKYKTETIEVRKESKLGFYYIQKKIIKTPVEKHPNKKLETDKTPVLYKTYTIYGPKYHYSIRYPYSYNNVNINVDLRPWDLVNNNGMEDHFITDLKKVLDNIFKICYKDNINLVCNNKQIHWRQTEPEKYINEHISNSKNDIYVDIFGFKDGPKLQSNGEKILSHGFDMKTSFRKPKDN